MRTLLPKFFAYGLKLKHFESSKTIVKTRHSRGFAPGKDQTRIIKYLT